MSPAAAASASPIKPENPAAARLFKAASVVPPLELTRSRSTAGDELSNS